MIFGFFVFGGDTGFSALRFIGLIMIRDVFSWRTASLVAHKDGERDSQPICARSLAIKLFVKRDNLCIPFDNKFVRCTREPSKLRFGGSHRAQTNR
jgi:hypothetical protein